MMRQPGTQPELTVCPVDTSPRKGTTTMTTTRTIPARDLTPGDTDPDGWVLTRTTPIGADVYMRWISPHYTDTRTWGAPGSEPITITTRNSPPGQTTIIEHRQTYDTTEWTAVGEPNTTQQTMPPAMAAQYLIDRVEYATDTDTRFGRSEPAAAGRRHEITYDIVGDDENNIVCAILRRLYPWKYIN